MTRVCTVCTHPERGEIDRLLVNRAASYRDIAGQFALSKTAVSRHVSEGHIVERLAMAREAEQAARADDLLRDLRNIRAHTIGLLIRAEEEDDRWVLLRALREARENVRILAELHGKLETQGAVNIHLSAEWVELKTVIIGALAPFPEARMAVLRAVSGAEELEGG